jgi:L-amino acid N-acyltransferase YncA
MPGKKTWMPGMTPGITSIPMPLVIRPATLADIPAITRIYEHAVAHGTATFELQPPDEAEMTNRMRALLDGGFPYLAAEDGGNLLGYAYAGLYRARPAYRFTVEDSIYIAPQAQRRGIGRALLSRLIADSESRGFRQMLAVIGDSAQTASIELHRALGFRMIGTFENVGYKFDRWLDTVMMQRALGEGARTAPHD